MAVLAQGPPGDAPMDALATEQVIAAATDLLARRDAVPVAEAAA